MSNTISTTVTSAVDDKAGYGVSSSYSTYVDAAVEALTEREVGFAVQIAEQINENFGVDEQDIYNRLERLGFAVPQPEPEPEPVNETPVEDDESVDGRLSRLEASVGRLVALAERHLGA